jgi:hypothetical protein
VIYSFDPTGLPVHVGQQVEVFIEAEGAEGTTTSPSPGKPDAVIRDT